MKTKDEFRRSLKLHMPRNPDSERLSNYHAVCIELERAKVIHGIDFSDSLVDEFNLQKFRIKKIGS